MRTYLMKMSVLAAILSWGVVWAAQAETNVVKGVAYECTDGICRMVSPPPVAKRPAEDAVQPRPARILQGYCDEATFLGFLRGKPVADDWADKRLGLVFLLAVLGGLAMNLTPCVLPMIPVNLLIIGKSLSRAFAYALGIMTAYGALGLAAALGGVAFGTIQSSAVFNAFVALVFVLLALSLAGVFPIDFSRARRGLKGGAFLMGALAAVLAGACVAPILVSVLLLTAKLYAEGAVYALALPFAVGLGLALPWPFLGAGLRVLPKPGAWMRWVNRAFAVMVLLLSVHYARQAWQAAVGAGAVLGQTANAVAPDELMVRLAHARRPVLVDCTASWCRNCKAMDRLIERSEAIRAALEPFEVIRLQAEDLPRVRALPGLDEIRGLPAFVLYD